VIPKKQIRRAILDKLLPLACIREGYFWAAPTLDTEGPVWSSDLRPVITGQTMLTPVTPQLDSQSTLCPHCLLTLLHKCFFYAWNVPPT
jgi:hypothetical protein